MVNVIDYVPGNTVLHRLNPVAKLALAAGIIVATFLADTFPMLVGLLALTLALGASAGVLRNLLSLLKLLVPLAVVMLVLQTVFMRGGDVLLAWVTTEGLITGGKACLRLLGVALPLILMLTVTKLNDLSNACVEVLHVPYRYAFTFTTALRFVPLLVSSVGKTDATALAAEQRGFYLRTRESSYKRYPIVGLDVAALVVAVVLIVAGALL